jgi:hypothetical protein
MIPPAPNKTAQEILPSSARILGEQDQNFNKSTPIVTVHSTFDISLDSTFSLKALTVGGRPSKF